jgi:hypothetical protein
MRRRRSLRIGETYSRVRMHSTPNYPRSRITPHNAIAAASNININGDNVGIDDAATTVITAVPVSFAGFVSGFADVTVAVFETGPGVAGSVTTSKIVAVAPLLSVPTSQVTVDVPLQVP